MDPEWFHAFWIHLDLLIGYRNFLGQRGHAVNVGLSALPGPLRGSQSSLDAWDGSLQEWVSISFTQLPSGSPSRFPVFFPGSTPAGVHRFHLSGWLGMVDAEGGHDLAQLGRVDAETWKTMQSLGDLLSDSLHIVHTSHMNEVVWFLPLTEQASLSFELNPSNDQIWGLACRVSRKKQRLQCSDCCRQYDTSTRRAASEVFRIRIITCQVNMS